MSLEADLKTTLRPVFANGFFPMVAPAKTVAPYAVYQLISGVPENSIDGATPNLTNAHYQVNIFGRDVDALIDLVQDAKDAMLAASLFKSVCINEMDSFEDPALLYGKQLEFSIWYDTN